jgi:hypothetical protein
MRLTERDRDIMRHAYRNRFLRSSHIVALTKGSPQQTLRRLQLLYHHGYLERPRAQIDYFHRGGSRPLVYGLGNKSTPLLRRENAVPHFDWQAKNRSVGRVFLEHALLVTDVLVGIELACRRGRVRLLSAEEFPLPEQTRKRREPIQWSVNFENRTKLGLVPDRVFALEFPNQPEDRRRAFYFLEADRGTMPVMRENLAQSSLFRKLLAYEATWTQNIHRTRLGLHRFRVLTVTTSAERVKHLIEACAQLKRGHGLFLFADADSFRRHADPLSFPWQTAHPGKTATLLE